MRLVAWNIRAGGGKRAEHICEALRSLAPDIVVLSEYRSGPPSRSIAAALAANGLTAQIDTLNELKPNVNGLLLASRAPLKRVPLRAKPSEPGRWLMAREAETGIAIAGMHIPNQHTGRKQGYHASVLALAKRWRSGPALFVGDTNSGKSDLDEERPVFITSTDQWFDDLAAANWHDGFRTLHPDKREYTWYSHKQNGFRLDQIFVNAALLPTLRAVRHIWPPHPDQPARRDGLSDHAALVADFA